jgi:glycosyltransferase involved in cell wall biosynthesis
VVPGSLDQLTGGYLYDARMVAALRARGHRVTVAELGACRPALDPVGALRLLRLLAGIQFDAVVLDELTHAALALALPIWRARPRRTRLVVLVHHLRCSEPERRVSRRLAALVERAALRPVDLVVCTSRYTAGTVERLVQTSPPIVVVEPGSDLHRAGPDTPPRQTPGPGRPFRWLCVAHWTPRKGILETLSALARTPPQLTLDLVGDLQRDPAYSRRVWALLEQPELRGRVRVHGRVPSSRLAGLYQQAHGLVLASTHEGYGMVLAEALAAGLPLVATRAGAIPWVVRDGLEAELVPPGEPAALTAALERLASAPGEWARRAGYARQRAASLPSWQQAEAAFAAALGQLAARDGQGADVAQLPG